MFKITQQSHSADPKLVSQFNELFDRVLRQKPGFVEVLDKKSIYLEMLKRARETKKFNSLVVLGVGGSSIGGRVIARAFDLKDKVQFFENADGFYFEKQLSKIRNLKNTHWCVISKSGKTLETLAQLELILQLYDRKKISWKKNVTVISELKKNPLSDWAHKNKIAILEIPENLGGRFSVLSPVGLFPAAFAGIKTEKFISGAKDILKSKELFSEFCAQLAASFKREEWVTALWIYSEQLKIFGIWFQQLWAESLGKSETKSKGQAPRASTPLPLVGTSDQHSVLQQIVAGDKDKFVIFIKSLRLEDFGQKIKNPEVEGCEFLKGKKLGSIMTALASGTQKSLESNKVSNMTIAISEINEKSLGALFMFFEMCVAMLGEYHNINAYDQPGVEYSKKVAMDLLRSRV